MTNEEHSIHRASSSGPDGHARCWSCGYDVSSLIDAGVCTCPECGSLLESLQKRHNERLLERKRRKHALGCALVLLTGVILFVGALFQDKGMYGEPIGETANLMLLGVLACIIAAVHLLDRMDWPLERKGMLFISGHVVVAFSVGIVLFAALMFVTLVFSLFLYGFPIAL